eukprot:15896-Heterococcus_DN1.PRE.3
MCVQHVSQLQQAVYTAGVVLPKPIACCRYFHRNLNPKKLIEVGFSRLASRMTMARTIRLYKVADTPIHTGLRPMELSDAPSSSNFVCGIPEYTIMQLLACRYCYARQSTIAVTIVAH